MASTYTHGGIAALLALGLLLTGCNGGRAAADKAPPVDGTRALARVTELVRVAGVRPAGSAGGRTAAAWIASSLTSMGLTPVTDTWEAPTPKGTKTLHNVSVLIPGAPTAGRLLLASHYDTKEIPGVPNFVGANDSGSSTGLLLELLQVLHARGNWQGPTLEAVFFDGEECLEHYGPTDGFQGSTHLAAKIKQEGRVGDYRAMILLDMIGDRELQVTLSPETDDDLARRIFALAKEQGSTERFAFYPYGSILDDHTAFQALGIPAVDLIDFSYGPGNAWWHTADDTVDKLSAQSLATVGNLVLGLVFDLAQRP